MTYPALRPQPCTISRTPSLWGYGFFVVRAQEGRGGGASTPSLLRPD